MEIVARIVSDAQVSETKSGKKVVNFSVAINDYYKPKNGEGIQTTTFVRCAYWNSEAIASRLLKGVLVELYGRIGVEAYTNKSGEPVGVINFHANRIKLHAGKKNDHAEVAQNVQTVPVATSGNDSDDDLPF